MSRYLLLPELSQLSWPAFAAKVGSFLLFFLLISNARAIVVSDDFASLLDDLRTSPNTPASDLFSVGKISQLNLGDNKTYECTGTPISSLVVLTAAHCLIGNTVANYFYQHTWEFISGQTTVYPGYDPVTLVGDLALLTLDTPLPSTIKPYKFASFGSTTVPWGLNVEIVGYGLQGVGSEGGAVCDDPPNCRNINPINYRYGSNLAFNRIDSHFSTPIYSGPPCLVYKPFSSDCLIRGSGFSIIDFQARNDIFGFDFDMPTDPTVVDRYGISYEGITDHGDSGGPVFFNPYLDLFFSPPPYGQEVKMVSNEYYLIGVTSFDRNTNFNNRTSDYGDVAGYTNIAAYTDWIFQEAGLATSSLSLSNFSSSTPTDYSLTGLDIIQPPLPFDPPAGPIPEPGSLALVGGALVGQIFARRRRT